MNGKFELLHIIILVIPLGSNFTKNWNFGIEVSWLEMIGDNVVSNQVLQLVVFFLVNSSHRLKCWILVGIQLHFFILVVEFTTSL